MPIYFLHVSKGGSDGETVSGFELPGRIAAWDETASVCSDLIGSVCRKLKPNDKWQMELLDEAKRPVFRIRLAAEALE
jgi:hypothetical protein